MTERTLYVDRSGNLWMTEDGGGDALVTLLGGIDDARTGFEVPAALLDRLAELELEWQDAVEYGRSCRSEAMATYRRNAL